MLADGELSEHKTVKRLGKCCTGEPLVTFERELHRLRGYRFRRLLVIGTESDIRQGRYFSGVNPESVLATLSAFEVRYECPIVFSCSPQAAACQIERWAFYFSREAVMACNDLWRSSVPDRVKEEGVLS